MTDALVQGDRVEIRDFGSFSVRDYGEYEGRNPKTGKTAKIKLRRLPYFRTGKGLRERLNSS